MSNIEKKYTEEGIRNLSYCEKADLATNVSTLPKY